jgi:hypothetical protein
LLISYAIAAAMVVADWLGWWWWVHRVTTNKRVLSFSPFGRFISSYSASSFHRSIRVLCALDLAWEHREERQREICLCLL